MAHPLGVQDDPTPARRAALARWGARVAPLLVLVAWAVGIARTGRWPAGDGPHVLGTAMRLAQQLHDGALGTFLWCLQSLIGPHPPGAYLPAVLAYTTLGTGRFVHLAAGALLLWLCWDGIRRLGGGVAGALWLGASGLVWAQAEGYGVDLVAAAFVCQSVSHLVASERLSQRRHALGWGAWMGLAFLGKYTAPMFLWAPCALAGWWVLRDRRWRELAAAFGAFCAVALPWYTLNLHGIVGYLQASTDTGNTLFTNKALVAGPWTSPQNLSWYPAVLLDAFGWPGAVALGLGVLSPRRGGLRPGAWAVPVLGALGGLLVLSTQIQRQDRYLLPALPLLAAAAGGGRARWALAPVAAVGVYGAAAMYLRHSPVPAVRDYEHRWEAAGRGWPWPQAAFRPCSLDPTQSNLDQALTRLREVVGSDEGTVGFLLDEAGGAPGFGLVMSRVASLGYRWHVATVMVQGPGGPQGPEGGSGPGGGRAGAAVFVGPFTTDDWPSRNFTTLLAILRPGQGAQEDWLGRSGLVEVERWSIPEGREVRILTERP